jgi:hypothetical protein
VITARITLRSNPRAIVPIVLPLALAAGAVVLALLVNILLGLLVFAGIAVFGYQTIRFASNQLRSFVAAGADGVRVCEFGETSEHYGWGEVTRFGMSRGALGEFLYIQIGSANRLISITREFANFELLLQEMRRHAEATDLDLRPGEELAERLVQLDAG